MAGSSEVPFQRLYTTLDPCTVKVGMLMKASLEAHQAPTFLYYFTSEQDEATIMYHRLILLSERNANLREIFSVR